MSSPARQLVADQILRGMTRELDPGKAGSLEAVLQWEIGDWKSGDTTTRFTSISAGRCRVSRRRPEQEPALTLKLGHVDLLELALGIARGPELYMTGRIGIEGDLMLAQRLTTLFRIPG